jgi:endonuclease YncB( thermonuclease family)
MRRVSKRKIKLLSVLIILILGLLTNQGWLEGPLKQAKVSQPGLYNVIRVSDGDTIDVDMNGYTETVRFIGVDTPETHRPNSPVQCYGREASEYTKALIGNNSVRLEADPEDTNRDRYGRLLRYVYLPDGTLVETKILSEGFGFAYTQFPFEKKQEFIDTETRAKQAGKGLWSACQVTIEGNGRKQTNPAE